MNIGIGVLFIVSVLPVTTQQQVKRGAPGREYDDVGYSNRVTVKRSATMLARMSARGIWKGTRAMKILLKGAEKLKTPDGKAVYRKRGDYNTAVKDFDSVNPTRIQIHDGKLTGVVGNRLLMIVPVRSEQYSVMGIKRIEYTLPPKGLDPTDTKLTTLIEYKNP